MPSAIAVNTKEQGPVTIPMAQVSIVRRNNDGTALVVLLSGQHLPTVDPYQKVSDRMVATQVWGTVGTETVL